MKTRTLRTTGALAVLTGAAVVAAAPPAAADPVKPRGAYPVTLVCDNEVTYDVVVIGNGAFTPAHDLASNSVLVPTAFGPFSGVITDGDGNVVENVNEEFGMDKGKATRPRATQVTCTYTLVNTWTDPELGPLTVTGGAAVTGFVTPAR